MIKADKAQLEIRGNGNDVIFELNHIFDMFLKCDPEIIITVSALWSEKMIEYYAKDMSNTLMNYVSAITEDYIKGCENKDE